MAWLSPAFPVGAFAYSSGLEWAVEAGDIADAETLHGWLSAMLVDGAGFCDAVFFAHAHRAARRETMQRWPKSPNLPLPSRPSRERFLETTAQGNAFLDATQAAWPCAALDRLTKAWPGRSPIRSRSASPPPAMASPLEPALRAYLQAVAANWSRPPCG